MNSPTLKTSSKAKSQLLPAPKTVAKNDNTAVIAQRPRGISALAEASPPPIQRSPTNFHYLQRTLGNRAMGRLIQTKLTVGPPDDQYEQEADRVADTVMRMPAPPAPQPPDEEKEDETIRAKPLAPTITPLIQRQTYEEKEPLQEKFFSPFGPQIQRQAEEDEMAQSKSLIQRQAEEDEMAQTKPLIQRQAEEDEIAQTKSLIQRQEEEDEVAQSKPLTQRQAEEEEMASSKPLIQRQMEEDEIAQTKPLTQQEAEEEVQTKNTGVTASDVSPDVAAKINSMQGGGKPLPPRTRRFFESRFDSDFSSVRIHSDSRATETSKSINAKAFTVGNNIAFGAGQYSPDTQSGKSLLAHELTHVLQQGGGVRRKVVPNPGQNDVDFPPERSRDRVKLETEELTHPQEAIEQEPLIAKRRRNDEDIQHQGSGQIDESREHADEKVTVDAVVFGSPDHRIDASENLADAADSDTTAIGSSGLSAPPEIAKMPTVKSPAENMAGQVEMEALNAEPNTAPGIPLPTADLNLPPRQPDAKLIQRSEDDDGLLGGIGRRINSIVNGLRSGWNSLSQIAQGAFNSIRSQVSTMAQGLSSFVSSAISGIQSGWSALNQIATQLTNGIKRQLQGAIGTVTGAVQSIADAMMRLDANALRAAWGRITGLIGGIGRRLQQAGQVVFQRIAGLWNGLSNRFNNVLSNLANRARGIFNRLRSAAQGLSRQLASAWDALRNRASQMAGVLGGILQRLRSLVNRLISWGQQIWNGIQQQWGALRIRVGGLLQQVQQRVTAAWQGLRQRAVNIWNRLRGLWVRLQRWIRQQVQRLIRGVRSIWNRIRNFPIGSLIAKIAKYARFIRAVEEAVQDPDAAMAPIVGAIAGKLEAEMPAKSLEIGRQRIQEQAGNRGGNGATTLELSGGEVVTQHADGAIIQRTPALRSTTSLTDIWNGFKRHISHKWATLDIWEMVKDMLWSILWPWPAVGRELSELWDEWTNAARSLFVTRNLFDDPLGFFHDLWTNILHLLDFPLILLRRLNNILLLLMGWITIILTALGFIGGGVAGTIIGGIVSALASLGIATPAGGAAGFGVGGFTGAGLGFATAMALGEVLVLSFLSLQSTTVVKTLTDLFTGRQTTEEKERDYSQLADSVIAVGVTAVLLFIGWFASRLASVILNFIKGKVPPPVRTAIEEFQAGARRTRPRQREALPEFPELKSRAQRLLNEIEAFENANPTVEGISVMRRAVSGELRFIERVLRGEVEATPERAQGTHNNLNGIENEFNVARSNANVIGVNRKFSLDGRPNAVEVDVVADGGRTWIDGKRVEPFGLDSRNWVGGRGKQGLRTQAQELLRSASQNPMPDGTVPRVVIDFPRGVSPEVAAELRAMGVEVRGNIVRTPPTIVPVPPKPPSDEDENGPNQE